MFFSDGREHFFRPLLGKYRGQVLDCLSALYTRLYGALADYSRALGREQLLEIFEESIARSPLLDEAEQERFAPPVRSQREQANWVLNQLLEHGWLERQLDEATLQSSFAFSRHGRLFTQPMVEASGRRFRTRHRNFSGWWRGETVHDWPVSFWGDLDYAGMAILRTLRQHFPALQAWRAGYQPLLELLQNGQGHAPDQGTRAAQIDPGNSGCEYADGVLLPALRHTGQFVDQESVNIRELENHDSRTGQGN